MRQSKNRRLFTTIMIFEIISAIVAFFVAWPILSNQLSEYFVDEVAGDQRDIALSVAEFVVEELDEPVNILKIVNYNLLTIGEDSNTVNQMLEEINSIGNYFEHIEIIDTFGKVVYTLPEHQQEVGFDRSNELFLVNSSTAGVTWSNAQRSPYSTRQTVAITLRNSNGYTVGYLDLSNIKSLSSHFIELYGEQTIISISDQHGIYLVDRNDEWVNERRVNPQLPFIEKLLVNQSDPIYRDANGASLVMATYRIPLNSWLVTVSTDYNNVFQGLNEILGYFVVFIVLVLSIFLLVSLWGTNRIITTIEAFAKRLLGVADGNLRFPSELSYQEFDQVNTAFDHMVNKIADRDHQLSLLAYQDALTGFYNRSYLDQELRHNMKFHEGNEYGMIFFDIDNFSHVNDTYGHHIGDLLLSELSLKLKEKIPHEVDIIRLGGDEFILMVRQQSEIQQNVNYCIKQILSITKEPINCGDRLIYFTVSIGVSYYPMDGNSFWELLQNADAAMYVAKSKGKDGVCYFDRSMNQKIEQRLRIEQNLRTALRDKEFFLEFQPQHGVTKNDLRGFEALIRWKNTQLGIVPPNDFIGIAEENRMILSIGEWVLREACQSIKDINLHFNAEYKMAVNASPVELTETDYAAKVIAIIEKYDIKPQWLEIEVTENVPISAFEKFLSNIKELKRYGVSISIDDFGTGYSSLSYLHRLPLDVLKVDRAFITNITESSDQNSMTEMVLFMANRLGLITVAEGVETPEQLATLRTMHCDYFQGYFISRPIDYHKLIVYITGHRKENR